MIASLFRNAWYLIQLSFFICVIFSAIYFLKYHREPLRLIEHASKQIE